MPLGTTYITLYQLRGRGLDTNEMREQQSRKLPVLRGRVSLQRQDMPPCFQSCCTAAGGMSLVERTWLMAVLCSQGLGFYCLAS